MSACKHAQTQFSCYRVFRSWGCIWHRKVVNNDLFYLFFLKKYCFLCFPCRKQRVILLLSGKNLDAIRTVDLHGSWSLLHVPIVLGPQILAKGTPMLPTTLNQTPMMLKHGNMENDTVCNPHPFFKASETLSSNSTSTQSLLCVGK